MVEGSLTRSRQLLCCGRYLLLITIMTPSHGECYWEVTRNMWLVADHMNCDIMLTSNTLLKITTQQLLYVAAERKRTRNGEILCAATEKLFSYAYSFLVRHT